MPCSNPASRLPHDSLKHNFVDKRQVAQLIEAAPTPFYRTILMTLYGTGVRRAELTRLKVSDIDSRRTAAQLQLRSPPLLATAA
jgi:integrase